jgi:hypothetical protein
MQTKSFLAFAKAGAIGYRMQINVFDVFFLTKDYDGNVLNSSFVKMCSSQL